MLIGRKNTRSGEVHGIITGTVQQPPKYNSQYKVTQFSVLFDTYIDESGKKQKQYLNLSAAYDLAEFARYLEPRDKIFATGKIITKEYRQKVSGELKTWTEMRCDFISLQPAIEVVGDGGETSQPTSFSYTQEEPYTEDTFSEDPNAVDDDYDLPF